MGYSDSIKVKWVRGKHINKKNTNVRKDEGNSQLVRKQTSRAMENSWKS